uniref:Uncharacterized protein n=1 Tax=Chromera velia CCMP2878 TaxID=1169474 RepID=A0A0G4GUG9_9ALVE|eukprot:Cvel_742.t1-p1 / transcript=Cvel_742.t1 / gene=Cvel_742 / organism=Chromera_velia_CCMP2878 / gene_product=hypothetical protein / transcript_product=hypothetical protein / location=Cvel_scaffold23:32215-37020(-) / protein_length=1065 / sequence_SO=supercontig / SO=protein_coding / is_pseudo=false
MKDRPSVADLSVPNVKNGSVVVYSSANSFDIPVSGSSQFQHSPTFQRLPSEQPSLHCPQNHAGLHHSWAWGGDPGVLSKDEKVGALRRFHSYDGGVFIPPEGMASHQPSPVVMQPQPLHPSLVWQRGVSLEALVRKNSMAQGGSGGEQERQRRLLEEQRLTAHQQEVYQMLLQRQMEEARAHASFQSALQALEERQWHAQQEHIAMANRPTAFRDTHVQSVSEGAGREFLPPLPELRDPRMVGMGVETRMVETREVNGVPQGAGGSWQGQGAVNGGSWGTAVRYQSESTDTAVTPVDLGQNGQRRGPTWAEGAPPGSLEGGGAPWGGGHHPQTTWGASPVPPGVGGIEFGFAAADGAASETDWSKKRRALQELQEARRVKLLHSRRSSKEGKEGRSRPNSKQQPPHSLHHSQQHCSLPPSHQHPHPQQYSSQVPCMVSPAAAFGSRLQFFQNSSRCLHETGERDNLIPRYPQDSLTRTSPSPSRDVSPKKKKRSQENPQKRNQSSHSNQVPTDHNPLSESWDHRTPQNNLEALQRQSGLQRRQQASRGSRGSTVSLHSLYTTTDDGSRGLGRHSLDGKSWRSSLRNGNRPPPRAVPSLVVHGRSLEEEDWRDGDAVRGVTRGRNPRTPGSPRTSSGSTGVSSGTLRAHAELHAQAERAYRYAQDHGVPIVDLHAVRAQQQLDLHLAQEGEGESVVVPEEASSPAAEDQEEPSEQKKKSIDLRKFDPHAEALPDQPINEGSMIRYSSSSFQGNGSGGNVSVDETRGGQKETIHVEELLYEERGTAASKLEEMASLRHAPHQSVSMEEQAEEEEGDLTSPFMKREQEERGGRESQSLYTQSSGHISPPRSFASIPPSDPSSSSVTPSASGRKRSSAKEKTEKKKQSVDQRRCPPPDSNLRVARASADRPKSRQAPREGHNQSFTPPPLSLALPSDAMLPHSHMARPPLRLAAGGALVLDHLSRGSGDLLQAAADIEKKSKKGKIKAKTEFHHFHFHHVVCDSDGDLGAGGLSNPSVLRVLEGSLEKVMAQREIEAMVKSAAFLPPQSETHTAPLLLRAGSGEEGGGK